MDKRETTWTTLNDESGRLFKACRNAAKQLRSVKTHAYKLAAAFAWLFGHEHAWLETQVRSVKKYATLPDPIRTWIDDAFAPYEQVGGDARELMQAINAGLTLKQHLAGGAGMFLVKAGIAKRARIVREVTAREPAPAVPVEEQLRYWKERAKALEAQCAELKRAVAKLERTLANIRKQFDRGERETA